MARTQTVTADAPPAESSPEAPAGREGYARPFVKWAGGKTQLLPQLARLYPPSGSVKRYLEPFLGGGAVFFHFKALVGPGQALLSDNNAELIDTFQAVQSNVDEVIKLLRGYEEEHSKEFFLAMREKKPRSPAGKAARLIYLNKTCFNGLYRVNSRGVFNVPLGRYANRRVFNESALRRAAQELAGATLEARDFRQLDLHARKGDFVYFDPPYHPLSRTSHFTAYTRESFGEGDQRELAQLYRVLDKRGCMLMLSNSDTPLVRELYGNYTIREVLARRHINSKGDGRGPICELVVVNRALLAASRAKLD